MQIKLLAECPSAQPLNRAFLESQNLSHTFPKRFWEKVQKTDGCWLWTAGLHRNGYGNVGRGGQNRQTMCAHRASWILHYGPIPDGLYVLHHCDCRSCTRPDHLWLGTQIDNLRDMRNKGRGARGERIPNAKLTKQLAEEIRAQYVPEITTMQALADSYRISLAAVFNVIHNKTWR